MSKEEKMTEKEAQIYSRGYNEGFTAGLLACSKNPKLDKARDGGIEV